MTGFCLESASRVQLVESGIPHCSTHAVTSGLGSIAENKLQNLKGSHGAKYLFHCIHFNAGKIPIPLLISFSLTSWHSIDPGEPDVLWQLINLKYTYSNGYKRNPAQLVNLNATLDAYRSGSLKVVEGGGHCMVRRQQDNGTSPIRRASSGGLYQDGPEVAGRIWPRRCLGRAGMRIQASYFYVKCQTIS